MDELVRAAGVSARTLYYGFRRYRGTTPQRFVKTMRLRLARDALMDCGDKERVSVIASRFGYGNAAQFSKDYRQMFGASPREALRDLPRMGDDATI